MVLDRTLADAEIGGDVLARLSFEHQFQDLTFAHGESGEALCGCVATYQATDMPLRIVDACERRIVADRSFDIHFAGTVLIAMKGTSENPYGLGEGGWGRP